MKIKQTLFALIILLGAVMALAMPSPTYADCGGVPTSVINCEQTGGDGVEDTGIWGILMLVINILTAGVGILAVGGIVYGAILYTSAGGSSEQIKKATTVFTNVVIGIVAYAAMYALLNFIIPGGIFN